MNEGSATAAVLKVVQRVELSCKLVAFKGCTSLKPRLFRGQICVHFCRSAQVIPAL